MNIFIVEDDITAIKLLIKIVEERTLGHVVDFLQVGTFELEILERLEIDIVLLDLLMPGVDGITLAKKIKAEYPEVRILMISQVSSKDMIGSAYVSGIDYYIQKPINALELESVLKRVEDQIQKDKMLKKIQSIISIGGESADKSKDFGYAQKKEKMKRIFQQIGILGESGSGDLLEVASYILTHKEQMKLYTLKEVTKNFQENAKVKEQRMRRAITVGLSNLAHLGIEDNLNENFLEYSNTLYSFEQIKKEMDYIRGKSGVRGKVNLKKFIDGLIYYCEK